jgi:tetratricopeptide (TPR) repeat protein
MLRDLTASRSSRNFAAVIFFALVFGLPLAARAEDPSVDQLIKKLPPPEKVVKTDPASRDPLAKQVVASVKAMNFGSAYAATQKLAAKYPQSAGAQSLHGQLAFMMRRYPEAAVAFHKATSIQPDFVFAYVGLALTDIVQRRFDAAMIDFRQVTRLAPNADIGWIGLSACSEKLGRKRDSLDYAKRATSAAPSSFAAWIQLAHEEGLAGDQQAASKAMARANQLRRTAAKRSTSR